MATLSWNEIRRRAIEFSQEFSDATRENSETHTFYNEFFNVFGISRRRVATFEEPVKKLGNKKGWIDLFWKGQLLVEQKSAGENLKKAKSQAFDYFPLLKEEELPRYLLICDFQNFELYDLDEGSEHKFTLADLHKNIEYFGFIAGYRKREFKDQDPVNIKASEMMGKLHDSLKDVGYQGSDLEVFLVRLLFCLFADDTTIFEKDIFKFYLEERTNKDGSDLGMHLGMLFQVLNTPESNRTKTLDEDLTRFPYVNGDLFNGTLRLATFDSTMREALLRACYFDWGEISPAIFGSLFQSVMDPLKRRGIGAHYTTEHNIMKVIGSLFLDDLRTEFEGCKSSKRKLNQLHDKIADLTFLDPACGCGNFLIIAYKELRLLEIEILQALYRHRDSHQMEMDITHLSKIDVDQFYA